MRETQKQKLKSRALLMRSHAKTILERLTFGVSELPTEAAVREHVYLSLQQLVLLCATTAKDGLNDPGLNKLLHGAGLAVAVFQQCDAATKQSETD